MSRSCPVTRRAWQALRRTGRTWKSSDSRFGAWLSWLERLPWTRTIRLQQLHQLLSLPSVFSNLGVCFPLKANPNRMKRWNSDTLLAQGTRLRDTNSLDFG